MSVETSILFALLRRVYPARCPGGIEPPWVGHRGRHSLPIATVIACAITVS